MQYALLICAEGEQPPDDAPPPDLDASAWVEEMTDRGILSFGDRPAPPEDATTVRLRNGRLVLTDGPFAETKELICGFDIIECADLDEAIEVASKHPMAGFGMIEVRPFWTQPPPS